MLEITLKVFGDWVNCRIYLSSFFSIGYRYELYCISKAAKTTQCTLHCDTNSEESWEWNFKRPESSQYSREVFDALVLRYEAPDSRNRWDSPLFTIHPDEELPFEHICGALFERKAPPPNQSTQSVSHSKQYCLKDFFTFLLSLATIDFNQFLVWARLCYTRNCESCCRGPENEHDRRHNINTQFSRNDPSQEALPVIWIGANSASVY